MKHIKKVKKGKKTSGYFSYLNNIEEFANSKAKSLEVTPDSIERALIARSSSVSLEVTNKIMESKLSHKEKWNEIYSLELFEAGKAHSLLVMYQCFKRMTEKPSLSKTIRNNLKELLVCFGLFEILKCADQLLLSGHWKAEHVNAHKEAYKASLNSVRPIALNMIETFQYSDNMLNSCIGNSHGDIYH